MFQEAWLPGVRTLDAGTEVLMWGQEPLDAGYMALLLSVRPLVTRH